MRMFLKSRFAAVLFVTAGLSILPVLRGQTAASQRGVQVVTAPASTPASTAPIGPYYALVIGNNNYKELNKLQTAVGDAKAVAQLLHDRFGFQTKLLADATRVDILDALDDYQRNLPEKSNLLIYYAGHGHKDVAANRAYWLPVDAQLDHSPNWINAVEITDKLRAIPARHILIIADSCWSGDLSMRSAGASITSFDHNALLAKLLSMKSRHIMSSGGDEPVADGGGGGHSVFSAALLQSLNDMDGDNFTAEALLTQRVQPRVAGRSQQTPEYAILRDSDSDLGDFVFFRSKNLGGHTVSVQDSSAGNNHPANQSANRTLDSTLDELGAGETALGINNAAANGARQTDSTDTQNNPTQSSSSDTRFQIGGPPDAQTVLDTKTGLMWTRIDYWDTEKSFATKWLDAMSWAAKLNAAAYGGYSDWSVPALKQYGTLCGSNEDRDAYLRVFQKTEATDFWSSHSLNPGVASFVDFKDGGVFSADKTGRATTVGGAVFPVSIRLVRLANGQGNTPVREMMRRNIKKNPAQKD